MKKLNRQVQKALTRKNLINAAMALFAEKGIAATNTADIAKAAGVSHGALFMHFPCRDDLVFAAISRFGRHLCAAFAQQTKKDKVKSLRGVLKAHLHVLETFEGFYSRLVMEVSLLSPKVKSFFFIMQATVSHRMFVNATQEIEEGKIKKIKRSLLFNTWIALIHYYLANRDLFSPGKSVIREKAPELLDHFMRLIKV